MTSIGELGVYKWFLGTHLLDNPSGMPSSHQMQNIGAIIEKVNPAAVRSNEVRYDENKEAILDAVSCQAFRRMVDTTWESS